jgi:aminoglycoside phosphotransferase (APT) family kinase protein
LPKSFPRAEVELAAGAPALRSETVVGGGYARNFARWSVELEDGRRVFVKLALDENAAGWLRDEHRVYSGVEAPFLAELVGWHDGEQTLLVLEDLSHAHWPPPWRDGEIDAVLRTLEAVAATPPPVGTPALEELRDWLDGWGMVAADPEPLLSTGLCSRGWLDRALPRLREATAACDLSGDDFLHLDVRSDNICLDHGRVVLVDWNHAHVGNGLLDVVAWLPSLRLEGGPEPWELVPDSGGFAAHMAGFFAGRAGLPAPPTAPDVRGFQLRQAEVALLWTARELGLSFPR